MDTHSMNIYIYIYIYTYISMYILCMCMYVQRWLECVGHDEQNGILGSFRPCRSMERQSNQTVKTKVTFFEESYKLHFWFLL